MKTLTYATIFLACVGLSLLGCSDKSQSPVAPTDQSASQPGSLGKCFIRVFTNTMAANLSDPNVVIDPGTTVYSDGKMIVTGFVEKTLFNATFLDGGTDLLTGNGVLGMDFVLDLATGVGTSRGTLTITPKAPETLGGVWEIKWHGTMSPGPSGSICPITSTGCGKGGALDGLKLFDDAVITLVDLVQWTGEGKGVIKPL